MKKYFILIGILFFSPAFALTPLDGLYKLTGSNPGDMTKTYQGKVAIQKFGEAYRLNWFIGSAQSQSGQAYLEQSVLSVGYMDNSGKDFGVVAYKVLSKKS